MTRALVVFESMFGNTRRVAQAVADGLYPHMPVEVLEVGVAPTTVGDDIGLVVVGGPTHAFGMSRPGTRQDAGRRLRRRGALLAAAPVSFYVTGTPGPLAEGEEKRAREWGDAVALLVTSGRATSAG